MIPRLPRRTSRPEGAIAPGWTAAEPDRLWQRFTTPRETCSIARKLQEVFVLAPQGTAETAWDKLAI